MLPRFITGAVYKDGQTIDSVDQTNLVKGEAYATNKFKGEQSVAPPLHCTAHVQLFVSH